MQQRHKLAGLTANQADLLKSLYFFFAHQPSTHQRGLRPSDLGLVLTSGSYESLRRLASEGLIERQSEGEGKHALYRITDAGVKKWTTLQTLTAIPAGAVLGPRACSNKLQAFAAVCGSA